MPATILTIAGFDPSGGAGIAADLKTIAALRCHGVAAVTALTVQNTEGVRAVHPVPEDQLAAQIESILADVDVRAVKIGMLGTARAVLCVADLLEKHDLPNVVLDPVLRSGSGAELLHGDAVDPLRERLFPRAALITPNLDEASQLAATAVRDVATMKHAAQTLHARGARRVVVKGGHLPGRPVDVLFDGEEFALFDANRVPATSVHGLGCTFSSAIACSLARGLPPTQAVDRAKRYVARALSAAYRVGRGSLLLDHGVEPVR